MQTSGIKAMKLMFSPHRFLEDEQKHIEEMRDAGKAYQSAEDYRGLATLRIANKRTNLIRSFLWIVSLVFGGWLMATIVSSNYSIPTVIVVLIRAASLVLLGWAVFGKLGDTEIETFKGETLLERTSSLIHRRSYSVGLLLGSFSLFLASANAA